MDLKIKLFNSKSVFFIFKLNFSAFCSISSFDTVTVSLNQRTSSIWCVVVAKLGQEKLHITQTTERLYTGKYVNGNGTRKKVAQRSFFHMEK